MAAKKMSITRPEEMAALVTAKVASGEYASDVGEAYDHLKANPGGAVSGDHVRDELYRLVSDRNRDVP
jgi:hypothetical protein